MGRWYCTAPGCRYFDDDCFQNFYYCNSECGADFVAPDEFICRKCMLKRLKPCPECGENKCTYCLRPGSDMCEQCEKNFNEVELRERRLAKASTSPAKKKTTNKAATTAEESAKPKRQAKPKVKKAAVRSSSHKTVKKATTKPKALKNKAATEAILAKHGL